MIYHRACGSSAYVIATEAFRILSTVGISSKGLVLSIIDIKTKTSDFQPEFYCVNCERKVSVAELACSCSHCGNIITIEQSYLLTKCGGIYCLEHATELSNNPRQIIPMAKIVEKASI
jgi:hypothetical protein